MNPEDENEDVYKVFKELTIDASEAKGSIWQSFKGWGNDLKKDSPPTPIDMAQVAEDMVHLLAAENGFSYILGDFDNPTTDVSMKKIVPIVLKFLQHHFK